MQIQTFKIFCDLAEAESFSRAAVTNSITQSAVSQQIRALEERYHAMLIERGKKSFALTQEGRVFLDASRKILEIYGRIGERISEMQNIVAGELRISTIFSIGLHELPSMLKKFRRLYPEVEVKVEYRRSTQVYGEVNDGLADIGLVAYPMKKKGLKIEAFRKDKLVLICPPSHALSSRKSVRLEDLQGERFVAFAPDLPTRKAIDRLLRSRKVETRQVIEFDNIETVKRAVEIESGVSIVPETTISDEVRSGSLVSLEIEGVDVSRPLGAVTKRNRGTLPAQRHFIKLLQGDLA